MELSEALSVARVSLDLQTTDKEAAIRELAQLAAEHGALGDVASYVASVLEREFLLSTGVGRGVAIPHAQTATTSGLYCCLGVSRSGIDFESIDEEPVHIICMIVAEEGSDASYLLLLSRISRLFAQRHVRQQVLRAGSPDEVLAAIRTAEAADLPA
ncbi:PTS sugar transporter subunit IIA [Candidatus Poribacteria bacterium]|jgi:fructose PTS system EIIBC or EIIC component|nr:PTS sugar transporter subunit IIA [Candidatus Poribacteria bacterium]MBT5534075.1 PTS sugar transporter subunit IIA [Candidatus Poribacteria bacterium]MBT5709471.1 PTS sugar transporter subunit IIA [Candidatus Poribacteria bacterium]MBT7096954.1 PTS sugar transporter subunit IIA [Candidatus Poribacteria bacterium]MBT7808356.1 PTS sugar transporter subunit IIA [Candidatus Poribacteria bacterium]